MIVVLRAVVLSALLILPATFAAGDEAQDALVAEGVKAYDDGDYQKAKDILLPLAEAGHPKAMNMIGLMHSNGYDYPQDRTIACNWYEQSAMAGYPPAMSNLSICFYWGDGRPQNISQAIFWDEKAAQLGHKNSQANLAAIYVDQDREKYLYWAQKAVANGSIKTKALMWGNGDGDLVTDLHWTDLVCVVVMIGWFDKRADYCD